MDEIEKREEGQHHLAGTKNDVSVTEELQQRKNEIIKKLKAKKTWILYLIMLAIAWFGYYIRTRNLPLLQGKWLPDVDSYAFLRYAEYIAVHGKLMANDALRYYPFGFDPRGEFGILSYCIAYLQKILQIFNPNATTVDAATLYPAISFFIAAIFFFLLVKKMFNYKAAIVSTAFLAVIPAFLYRTMAGVADKEALAVALAFAALYFYISALKEERTKYVIINSILAGITNGVLATVWGGYVFVMMTIGLHAIIMSIIGRISLKQAYAYSIWAILLMIVSSIIYPARFTLMTFLTSITSQVMVFGLLTVIVSCILRWRILEKHRAKIESKMPAGLFAVIVSFMVGLAFILVSAGTNGITGVISELYDNLFRAFAGTRWSLTVAENHRPYFVDWIGQFSKLFLAMAFSGAVLAFYNILKPIKTIKRTSQILMTAIFGLLFLLFSLSRYSSGSMFNGENTISNIAYIGSLILLVGILAYGYAKHIFKTREAEESLASIDLMLPFLIIWLIIMVMSARSAIRLLFIFAPVTAVLAGYLTSESIEYIRKQKKDAYKIVGFVIVVIILFTTFNGFSKSVLAQASYVGPSFNPQWQNGMSWARENTPEDAVFAHWWDYGYWVQWGANRATIVDGGNAMGSVNHFVGRHVLTAQNEMEALEFLKSRNVSYLLAVSEEIGKYPAFSSIGADKNYDRYSWIPTMAMQPEQTKETREGIIYLFAGGTPLDDDFIYQGKLFPANGAGIGAILLPIQNVNIEDANGTKTIQRLMQPEAIIVYSGQQVKTPLRCVYVNGQEYIFQGKDMLEGCLRVIPSIDANGQMNPLGAGLYLSPEVYKGLFAKIYLLNQEFPNIKLAYSDENSGMPLAIYQGRLIGPMKIWKITYPPNVNVPEYYYTNELPDPSVLEVRQ